MRVAEAFDFIFEVADNLTLDARHTQFVLRKRAAMLGLLTQRHVLVKRLEEFMHAKLDREVLKRHRLHVKTAALTDFLRGKRPLRNPLQNAVLIAAFYESLEDFRREMHEAIPLTDLELKSPTNIDATGPDRGANERLVGRYLQRVTTYFKQNPGASRKEAWVAVGHSIAALNRFVPGVADQILPPRRIRRSNPVRVQEEVARRDAAFAVEIRRRRAQFECNLPSFRITRTRLIEGWINSRSIYRYRAEMLLTMTAIAECEETTAQYAERRSQRDILGMPTNRPETCNR
ncbi:hypothetical protein PQR67_34125 [Paraburkholderia fungorum]|uniref:hypothetical protein n=1 Tax=Paraburkholderia fungorum TaxID=134537 RepID=UPI0038B93745